MCRTAIVNAQTFRMLSNIRSEAGIRDILALVAMIADENSNAARGVSCLADEPCCGASQLPVVGTYVTGAAGCGLISDVSHYRDALLTQCLYFLANQGVVAGNDRDCVADLAEGA